MSEAQALDLPVAFLAVSLTAVLAVVLLLVPVRSGRAPLALFDQFAAYGIVGVLGVYSVLGVQGLALWAPGLAGLAAGLMTYVVANRLWSRSARNPLLRQGSNLLAFFGCAFFAALASFGGRWLLGA